MKTIQSRILRPMLLIVIIIPLISLLLFNIAMHLYIRSAAEKELTNTATVMVKLIRQEIASNRKEALANGDDTAVADRLSALALVMRSSKLAINTELLLFNKKYELLLPKNRSTSFISDDLLTRIKEILPDAAQDKTYTLASGSEKYLVKSYSPKGLLNRRYFMVIVSSLNSAQSIIDTVNLVLIVLMLGGILAGALVALRLSASIARPILNLCSSIARIGSGEFVPVDPDTGCKELNELGRGLGRMSRQLENHEAAQKTFFQNASHELRTPLMSIQGYAEGIMKQVLPDDREAAGVIYEESRRLNDLVEELLTLSRIESGGCGENLLCTNLCDVTKDYLQRAGGLAMKTDIRIESDLPNRPVYACIDDTLLSRAVLNLIDNAVRYAKSRVLVSLSEENGMAAVAVTDDGEGISEDDLPHLFDRFYKGKKGNHGLGLSIVRSAAQCMGGSVSAQNTGAGARFILLLPSCAPPANPPA